MWEQSVRQGNSTARAGGRKGCRSSSNDHTFGAQGTRLWVSMGHGALSGAEKCTDMVLALTGQQRLRSLPLVPQVWSFRPCWGAVTIGVQIALHGLKPGLLNILGWAASPTEGKTAQPKVASNLIKTA